MWRHVSVACCALTIIIVMLAAGYDGHHNRRAGAQSVTERRGRLNELAGGSAEALRRVLGSAVVLGSTLALVAPGPAAADWPVYGHDLANSRSAGSSGPSMSQVGSLHRAWAFKSSNGDFTGTPVVAGGTLVAGANLGSVYALNPVTGQVRRSR